ncbi:hypothetical protein A9Q74_12460 [Colwellia sp. 39_35_sub15_T18]|nr:hypothetical protein A9Q74_12460 [Colwellia sp. 39_35_sub15_T18]
MFGFFTRTTVQARLIIGFSIVLIMMIVITIVGISSVDTINESMTIITDKNSAKQRYAINFRGSVHDRAIAIRDVVLIKDANELEDTLQDIERLETFYNDSRIPLDRLMMNNSMTEEIVILNKIKGVEEQTMPLVNSVISAIKLGEQERANSLLLDAVKPAFTEWLASIHRLDLKE